MVNYTDANRNFPFQKGINNRGKYLQKIEEQGNCQAGNNQDQKNNC
jgi:hypothetical protein